MNSIVRLMLPLAACVYLYAQTASEATPPRPFHFRHVVIVYQENRTPDNLFQGLCKPPFGDAQACSTDPAPGQYDIQTTHWFNKKSRTGYTDPGPVALANRYDLSHAHSAFVSMCDAAPGSSDCKMDGAINIPCSGICSPDPQYKYVENAKGILDPYLQLATGYGWGNYMFQTNQGPSYPAHQFIFGGTSAPDRRADLLGTFVSENPNGGAGCAASENSTVQLINAQGEEVRGDQVYPCFEHETLPDALPGVSWRYYAPSAGSIWTAPNSIASICGSNGKACEGKEFQQHVDLVPSDVLRHIATCDLQQLSWVIPTGANSDHAKGNDGGGPSWVASIVNAIGTNKNCDGKGYWQDTVILITWDDWGGWYDHVRPQFLPYPEGGYQLGFRVPLIVVSAYTPRHYVNNVPHDFGSLLRFVERNFGTAEGSLGFADARATSDLEGFFDFGAPARPFRSVTAALPASYFLNDKRLDPPDTD